MDRPKPPAGAAARGPKAKLAQQPPDLFIALGAKTTAPRDDPAKRAKPAAPKGDKPKREAPSLPAAPPAKKAKPAPGAEPWEALAADCDPAELFEGVMRAASGGAEERAVALLLGAVRSVRAQRAKPCKVVYLSLLLAGNCRPALFANESVVAAIVSVLRRDVAAGLKKTNSYFHILFINLLTHAFSEVADWPEVFVKIYVEDAVADRIFIDNPFVKPFIDNITTAFNTKLPPSALIKSETWSLPQRDTSSPLTISVLDDETKAEILNEHKTIVDSWNVKTMPRFTQCQEGVEKIVLEAIKEQLTRRAQPENITKNFVRFLSIASGLVEIRIISVARIENWLQNHKLMKVAQELLAYLCYNCSANSQRDLEIILQLSKLKLKSKPMANFFNNCLKEMVYSFPENLYPLLKYTIYNELANARNSNNLIVVGALFQVQPEASAEALADICLELLLNKDDYLRSLRALLKEINRVLRHEYNPSIVRCLLRDRPDFSTNCTASDHRERIFLSIIDLIAMSALLCVSPQVRDVSSQAKRDAAILKSFQLQVGQIQRDAIAWLNDAALKIFRPNVQDYHHALIKILFLEQAEHYYKIDSWPGENERNLFLRLVHEVPISQSTLLRVLLIGVSKEIPVTPTEALEIADQLVRRSANLPVDCLPPLLVDNFEILTLFFTLCGYNYPENIILPVGYTPPKLAIGGLYWKTWLILLILAAHNPETIGSEVWNKYPTLRMFMEMCITNYFTFPPPTMIDDDYQAREQQLLVVERQKILEFETYLAAASTKMEITETTSLLLPQLMELGVEEEARRPPQAVLDQLQLLNASHKLGHLLCRSRNPDFLLDIMSRQGHAHMPWLAELVHSSEGALAHLPVQCLCEYLLSTAPTETLTKHGQLLAHLRNVIGEPNAQNDAGEVLEYLFRRLTSEHGASRNQATKGLDLLLAPNGTDLEVGSTESAWLSDYILKFQHFGVIRSVLIQFLRQALQIETNPARVSCYINFLATQEYGYIELQELITDLSSVIIERHSVASYVLPGDSNSTLMNLLVVFLSHLKQARLLGEESLYGYPESVLVSWSTGEQCHLQTLIIHAAIILLTYGPLAGFEPYTELLDLYFPTHCEHPRAYTSDTNERTTFLPDWIKLRMIRSNVERLVDAAIEKLEPPKLVLFIQSFGIPTNSISKLLGTLDKATILDPKLVIDSVLDKSYMIQLVQVQQKRGATGGDIFVSTIEMQFPSVVEMSVELEGIETKRNLPVNTAPNRLLSRNELRQLVDVIFDGTSGKSAQVAQLGRACVDLETVKFIFLCLETKSIEAIVEVINRYGSISILFRAMWCGVAMANGLLARLNSKHPVAAILQNYINQNKMEISKPKIAKTSEKLLNLLQNAKTDSEKTGILVDWLSTVDLEDNKDTLQRDLLFSKEKHSFRPLLISLLLQRASWKSLSTIMEYLLGEQNGEVCSISALDFLCALSQSPKLWQGRDKTLPKHHRPEDIFNLSYPQTVILISYIVQEAKQVSNWKKKMESRLVILLPAIESNSSQILTSLLQPANADPVVRELLIILYMSVPSSGQNLIKSASLSKEIYSKNGPSVGDGISHSLLSAMAATPRSKDWPKKSQELEICARKLAATHPVLILRQLPLLAGSLKGRAQYDWSVLKYRGHLMLFSQVFGLLELLQPVVFEQKDVLCDLLDSYFLLIQYHGHLKELGVLTQRLIAFVQNWTMRDVGASSQYLREHGAILMEMQGGQSVGDSNQNIELLIRGAQGGEALPPHWAQILAGLQAGENLSLLQELEHLSAKKPQLLKIPAQYLYNFVTSLNGGVRAVSLTLIVRWLKFCPSAAREGIAPILAALSCENGEVVGSLLERLSDLVLVMPEYGQVVLTKVFQLGMGSTLNTTCNIMKCVDLLNLQSGC